MVYNLTQECWSASQFCSVSGKNEMARRVNEGQGRSAAACTKYWAFFIVGFVVTLVILISLYFWISNQKRTDQCKESLSEEVNGTVLGDGSLRVRDGRVFGPDDFYVVNGVTRACVCRHKPCIRKCCREHQVYGTVECVNRTDSSFDPGIRTVYNGSKDNPVAVSANHFHVLYGDVCSNEKYLLNDSASPQDENYLMLDGTILFSGRFIDPTLYCFTSFKDDDHVYTLMCFPEEVPEITSFTVYPVGMIISIPFLFVTFLVYAIIPDLRNLHGKSLMCHVFSLVIAYSFLTVVQLGNDAVHIKCCIAFAFIIQFSFLASFFWLNIMCFDIWWVFSGLRPLRGSVKEREYKKFIIYSTYAWGCPFIIFVISVVMDYVEQIPDSFIKPHFGVSKCWFHEDDATLLYFYLPIGILVLLNIIMFVTTAYRLKVHTKETQVLKGGESKRHDESERQRFNLYLKLFIVMGINWVMELVSFFLQGPKYVWFVTDVGNTLQGVLIFLIFVWKRRILRLLNHKLCPKIQLIPATSTTSRSKVSPSRTTTTSINKLSSINSDSVCLKKLPTSDESDAPP